MKPLPATLRSSASRFPAVPLLLIAILTLAGCSTTKRLDSVLVDARLVAPGERSGITWSRGGVLQAEPAHPGLVLEPGDRLRTGPRTYALIDWENKTEVILLPDTEVHIASLYLLAGQLLAKVRGAFRVETDDATVAVAGTQFLLSARPGSGMQVTVFEGKIDLLPRDGAAGWGVTPVHKGEVCGVKPGRRLVGPRDVRRDQFDYLKNKVATLENFFPSSLVQPDVHSEIMRVWDQLLIPGSGGSDDDY